MVRRGAAARALLASSACLSFALVGCGVLPGHHGDPAAKGMTPGKVENLLLPDAKKAVKATVPNGYYSLTPGDDDDCGGSFLSDSQNDTKVIGVVYISVEARSPDPHPLNHFVKTAAAQLRRLGWSRRSMDAHNPDEAAGKLRVMAKPGVPGTVHLTASYVTLKSGKRVPEIDAEVITGCLRNPYHKD
jgi:hypothetical protein